MSYLVYSRYCALVFLIGLTVCSGYTVQQAPNDTTFVLGRPGIPNMTHRCRVSANATVFQWKAVTVANPEITGLSIFQIPSRATGEPIDSIKYRIDNTYDLTVTDVRLHDGGFYFCRVDNDEQPARLIVINTPRLLMYDMTLQEDNHLWFRCEAEVGGLPYTQIPADMQPTLKIMFGSEMIGERTMITVPTSDGSIYNITVEDSLTVTPSAIGQDLKCMVTTVEGGELTSVSHNLNIAYSPRNFTISPRRSAYFVGDVISCDAQSNPAAIYHWEITLSSANMTLKGHHLEVTQGMDKQMNSTCVAIYNGVRFEEDFSFAIRTDRRTTTPVPGGAPHLSHVSPLVFACLAIASWI